MRQSLGHFIVNSGGLSCVETAGELVECLRSIRRLQSLVQATELQVPLLLDGDRLPPALTASISKAALRSMPPDGGCAAGRPGKTYL